MTYTNTITHVLTTSRDKRFLLDWKNWPRPIIYLVTNPGVEPFMLGSVNRPSVLDHLNKPCYHLKVDLVEVIDDDKPWKGFFHARRHIHYNDAIFYPSVEDALNVWQVEQECV